MAGRKVGRYQIQSVLGKGSMGVVYSAHDPALDRPVAIKTIILPPGLTPYQRDKRIHSLVNEARLAARLNHPGIVRVYDAGEQESEPFIVLERVEGHTLAETLAAHGAMPAEAAVPLIQEILSAMAYAHEQGLVHRDLKPANIMVQPDGHARVMDFGIAHLAGTNQVRPEALAGTPRYMSPEQFAGQHADPRSDVFSLGVVCYEMLAGRHPFPQNDYESFAAAVSEVQCPPIQSQAARLPAGIGSLITRAMAKRPEDRFPSARQMLDALAVAMAAESAAQALANDPSRKEIVDFILQKISRQGDFPTTMQYISTITHATRKENSSAHTISQEILKDFALTNRILRMVNSPFYNGARRSISTISRAVVVLGVDAVLDVAAGLSIFDHFHKRGDVARLKALTVRALMTAFHAREIAGQVGIQNSEEAFICGMMHHLGRLIVAFYFPEEQGAIEQMVRQGAADETAASRKVMRISYAELGEAIAQSWHLPETVFKCSRGLDPQHKGALRTPELLMQGVVSMASELSRATMIPDENRRAVAQAGVARQFDGMLNLSPRQLRRISENSVRNAWDISHTLRVNLKDLGVADSLLATAEAQAAAEGKPLPMPPPDDLPPSLHPTDPADEMPHDENSDAQRQEFLMKTIGEITTALMGTYQLNDVLMMVLEGMYRGVGSQHVLLALVNPQRTHLTYRFGLGPGTDEIRQVFHLPLATTSGLPGQCINEAREIFVADLGGDGRRGQLPAELSVLLRAKSILLLPIVIRDLPIGLFLLDRGPDQSVINKQDLINLRTLANQAVLAIKQCQARR